MINSVVKGVGPCPDVAPSYLLLFGVIFILPRKLVEERWYQTNEKRFIQKKNMFYKSYSGKSQVILLAET